MQNLPLQPNIDTHNYETRTQHHIYQPKTKHEYAKHYIRFHITKTINNSPNFILEKLDTHSLKCLSGYIKTCFLGARVNCVYISSSNIWFCLNIDIYIV